MIEQLNNYFLRLKESGYTDKELSILMKDVFLVYQPDDINSEALSDSMRPWIEAHETEYLSSEKLREGVLEDTLLQYISKDFEEYTIIKNHLLDLSMYDKIISRDGVTYFFLIDMLLANYSLHVDALKAWYELEEAYDTDIGGVALSKSTTPKKIISNQLSSLNTLRKSMPENYELEVRENIYQDYLKNPSAINFMLHTVSFMGGIKSLTNEENSFLLNSQKVVNSRVPFRVNTIYKSVNIIILLLFGNNTQFIKILKPKKHISINKMININTALMQNLFEIKNTLNKKNITKVIQVKTYFNNIPLYEFQTNKNKYIHPVFEDTKYNQEHWNNILEFIKGKIPPKEPR